MSALFTAQFADQIGVQHDTQSPLEEDPDTPRSSSGTGVISPITPSSSSRFDPAAIHYGKVAPSYEDQLASAKLARQRYVWDLEAQIRELKTEVAELKLGNDSIGYCEVCGRGSTRRCNGKEGAPSPASTPHARPGISFRIGSAS